MIIDDAVFKWLYNSRPPAPDRMEYYTYKVADDGRSVVYRYRSVKWNMFHEITVATPERIIDMPIPDWIDGYEYESRQVFISEARELLATFIKDATALLESDNA